MDERRDTEIHLISYGKTHTVTIILKSIPCVLRVYRRYIIRLHKIYCVT